MEGGELYGGRGKFSRGIIIVWVFFFHFRREIFIRKSVWGGTFRLPPHHIQLLAAKSVTSCGIKISSRDKVSSKDIQDRKKLCDRALY